MAEISTEEWQGVKRELRRLSIAINKTSRETAKNSAVIDRLNGGLEAIHELKAITPQLKTLADHSGRVIDLANAKADDEAFWRGLRKRLNPLKPVGAGIWLIFLASISGLLVKIFLH